MNYKKTCKLCDGKGGWRKLVTPEWVSPPIYEWESCWNCAGVGEISDLQDAIDKARGKSKSIPFRGYG